MNIFCDTSALIKKYIIEPGSGKFDALINETDTVYVSAITEIETISTFKRLLIEHAIDKNDYGLLIDEFEFDRQYYSIIPFNDQIVTNAIQSIDIYQLKTLDSIQLGTAMIIKDEIDYFVACDEKLIKAALKEKIKVFNPNK
jgi:predicted nucleic acid-binding protein